ncbi:hypothetical protein, partial [Sulfuricurvum sp. RIFCSPLOWO2_12_FULL_43_24]|uniref:hypothetical protein n=1 Tax=Sulfuricurvum sp. RIFCSPLOWO2_12_FULL_43_24 TaxID=1802247 RepID=UPI000B260EC3
MMTTARKSFLVSLAFHALMGSLAFVALIQMRTPPPMVKIPLKHLSIVSLTKPTPHLSAPIPVAVPQPSIPTKPITAQPIIPTKALSQPVQTQPT